MAAARNRSLAAAGMPLLYLLTNIHRDTKKHPAPISWKAFLRRSKARRDRRRDEADRRASLTSWLNQFPPAKQ